jgi:hypothetical protein
MAACMPARSRVGVERMDHSRLRPGLWPHSAIDWIHLLLFPSLPQLASKSVRFTWDVRWSITTLLSSPGDSRHVGPQSVNSPGILQHGHSSRNTRRTTAKSICVCVASPTVCPHQFNTLGFPAYLPSSWVWTSRCIQIFTNVYCMYLLIFIQCSKISETYTNVHARPASQSAQLD